MQARTLWSPPHGTLGVLCQQAAGRAEGLRRDLRRLRREALTSPPPRSLEAALRRGTAVGVIAEIKRRSPSLGVLEEALDAAERAGAYCRGGAAAISVLTEPAWFGGSDDDLTAVRDAVALPVLKKDFHVEAVQVWQARALGASALLFIARALGPEGLCRLRDIAGEAGIEVVFEVRDEAELDWALEAGALLVGVNRRDLETLIVDDDVPARILPRIPQGCIAIAESGIRDGDDVIAVAELGADAVLVGTSLTRAGDAEAGVRRLVGVPRRAGGSRG